MIFPYLLHHDNAKLRIFSKLCLVKGTEVRTALLYTCLLVSACDSGLENVNPPAVAEYEHASPSNTTPNASYKLQVEASASALPAAALPGGETTFIELSPLSPKSAAAFSQPSANLDSKGRPSLGLPPEQALPVAMA